MFGAVYRHISILHASENARGNPDVGYVESTTMGDSLRLTRIPLRLFLDSDIPLHHHNLVCSPFHLRWIVAGLPQSSARAHGQLGMTMVAQGSASPPRVNPLTDLYNHPPPKI